MTFKKYQLKGVPAGTIDPVAKVYVWEMDYANVPDRFIVTLAKELVSLHQINQEDAKRAGLLVETVAEARTRMSAHMERVKSEFGISEPLWIRWQRWIDNAKCQKRQD